jgi:Alternate to MurJ
MIVFIVCLLTFVIHFITTIAHALRIVNVRTQKSATTWSLFNILMIGTRMALTLQAPLLAKYVENSIQKGAGSYNNIGFFRYIILASILGSMIGGLAIPTAHRLLTQVVEKLYQLLSMPQLFRQSFRRKNWQLFRKHFTIPSKKNWALLTQYQDIPVKIMALHVLNNSFVTVSILSCLLAGYLNPEIRVTAISLSGFISGLSIIVYVIFADPDVAILTDKVLAGEQTEVYYRKYMVFVLFSRFLGTVLALFMLVPLAYVVTFIAKYCIF